MFFFVFFAYLQVTPSTRPYAFSPPLSVVQIIWRIHMSKYDRSIYAAVNHGWNFLKEYLFVCVVYDVAYKMNNCFGCIPSKRRGKHFSRYKSKIVQTLYICEYWLEIVPGGWVGGWGGYSLKFWVGCATRFSKP